MFETLPKLDGTARVELIVDGRSIIVELDGDNAPITAGNFVDLVQRGVYDGLVFHRREENFVVQGGDPQSLDPDFPIGDLGTGGFIDPETEEERNIPLEIKLEGSNEPIYNTLLGDFVGDEVPTPVLENDRGAIAMARSSFPDSASSQFYFPLNDSNFLDGNFAAFGRIVEGLEVIDTIEVGTRISDAEVIEGIENLVLEPETPPEATIGNFVEKIGSADKDILSGLDLEIVFGSRRNDTLFSAVGSLAQGKATTILVGGSGNDRYRISDNSTAIILENGSSFDDTVFLQNLDIDSNSSFIAEIDNRHLYLGDTESNQYAILVDWQEAENRIESFAFDNNITRSYNQLASNFNESDNYLGNFSWEQIEELNQINVDLDRIGFTPSSINDDLTEIVTRASEIETSQPSIFELDIPIYRFQNSDVPGTYLFVQEDERANILENFTNFVEEGLAFKVAVEPGDDLIPLYRFQSTITPGTYVFAEEEERDRINQNFADSFNEEGLAFYVYGADSDLGTGFSRFQNSDLPGTYLFATGEERDNIRANFPNFVEEGLAFEVDI